MAKKLNLELHKEWERRFSVFRSSGQTQANWCKANDISIHQLKYWLKRIEGSKYKPKISSQWVSVELEDSTNEHTENVKHGDGSNRGQSEVLHAKRHN
ncbi:IS66 family insertion sequence element accessory protein TnpA [Metabacillus halosaccharovorans]